MDQSARSVRDFAREDIVFFSFRGEKGAEVFVSRVVGIPGDRISLTDGRLLRNGEEVDEYYLPQPCKGIYLEETVVPRGHLFVLNDNREQLSDSRSVGPVPWTTVYGRITE